MFPYEMRCEDGCVLPADQAGATVLQLHVDVLVRQSRVGQCLLPSPIRLHGINSLHQGGVSSLDRSDVQRLTLQVEAANLPYDLLPVLLHTRADVRVWCHGLGG